MRWILAVAVVVLVGCAARVNVATVEENPWPIDTSKTMQLLGFEGIAQACPVEGIIYTAAHVLLHEFEGRAIPVTGYSFSTDEGNMGTVIAAKIHSTRDIAVLYVQEGAVNYYKLGPEPEDGDLVYWREYNFEDDILAEILVEAYVTRTIAGHIIVDEGPVEGASGGCLFNEDGEAVGVVVWNVADYGAATSIAGPWALHNKF